MGRAPIVKISLRIPPTPVAAPWKGSTAEGWLWDSILNANCSPSPISTTPAFSPGPTRMRSGTAPQASPVVGNCLSKGREFL